MCKEINNFTTESGINVLVPPGKMVNAFKSKSADKNTAEKSTVNSMTTIIYVGRKHNEQNYAQTYENTNILKKKMDEKNFKNHMVSSLNSATTSIKSRSPFLRRMLGISGTEKKSNKEVLRQAGDT